MWNIFVQDCISFVLNQLMFLDSMEIELVVKYWILIKKILSIFHMVFLNFWKNLCVVNLKWYYVLILLIISSSPPLSFSLLIVPYFYLFFSLHLFSIFHFAIVYLFLSLMGWMKGTWNSRKRWWSGRNTLWCGWTS